MSYNTFGHLFRVTTWGESHGRAIGCVVDGAPPNMPLVERDLQVWLDKRRPAQSRFTTQRKEADKVQILSGTYKDPDTGKPHTTGTPIQLLIENTDQRTKDYNNIKDSYRPGHADFTYDKKYGIRDPRGGGRSSARETAMRVAAGGIARKILGDKITIRAALIQMGAHKINRDNWNWNAVSKNPFWCPDAQAAKQWESYLDDVRKSGSSCGAVIEVIAENVPAGWGAPLYGKLDAELAAAMMSINAVKGVEIGDGFAAAALRGEDNADEITTKRNKPHFTSNHAGGILGGISSGQNIVVRFAVKPTSSILTPRQSITSKGKSTIVQTKGRHDPCVGIRAVPVGEAMMACVLADHKMRHLAQKDGAK